MSDIDSTIAPIDCQYEESLADMCEKKCRTDSLVCWRCESTEGVKNVVRPVQAVRSTAL